MEGLLRGFLSQLCKVCAQALRECIFSGGRVQTSTAPILQHFSANRGVLVFYRALYLTAVLLGFSLPLRAEEVAACLPTSQPSTQPSTRPSQDIQSIVDQAAGKMTPSSIVVQDAPKNPVAPVVPAAQKELALAPLKSISERLFSNFSQLNEDERKKAIENYAQFVAQTYAPDLGKLAFDQLNAGVEPKKVHDQIETALSLRFDASSEFFTMYKDYLKREGLMARAVDVKKFQETIKPVVTKWVEQGVPRLVFNQALELVEQDVAKEFFFEWISRNPNSQWSDVKKLEFFKLKTVGEDMVMTWYLAQKFPDLLTNPLPPKFQAGITELIKAGASFEAVQLKVTEARKAILDLISKITKFAKDFYAQSEGISIEMNKAKTDKLASDFKVLLDDLEKAGLPRETGLAHMLAIRSAEQNRLLAEWFDKNPTLSWEEIKKSDAFKIFGEKTLKEWIFARYAIEPLSDLFQKTKQYSRYLEDLENHSKKYSPEIVEMLKSMKAEYEQATKESREQFAAFSKRFPEFAGQEFVEAKLKQIQKMGWAEKTIDELARGKSSWAEIEASGVTEIYDAQLVKNFVAGKRAQEVLKKIADYYRDWSARAADQLVKQDMKQINARSEAEVIASTKPQQYPTLESYMEELEKIAKDFPQSNLDVAKLKKEIADEFERSTQKKRAEIWLLERAKANQSWSEIAKDAERLGYTNHTPLHEMRRLLDARQYLVLNGRLDRLMHEVVDLRLELKKSKWVEESPALSKIAIFQSRNSMLVELDLKRKKDELDFVLKQMAALNDSSPGIFDSSLGRKTVSDEIELRETKREALALLKTGVDNQFMNIPSWKVMESQLRAAGVTEEKIAKTRTEIGKAFLGVLEFELLNDGRLSQIAAARFLSERGNHSKDQEIHKLQDYEIKLTSAISKISEEFGIPVDLQAHRKHMVKRVNEIKVDILKNLPDPTEDSFGQKLMQVVHRSGESLWMITAGNVAQLAGGLYGSTFGDGGWETGTRWGMNTVRYIQDYSNEHHSTRDEDGNIRTPGSMWGHEYDWVQKKRIQNFGLRYDPLLWAPISKNAATIFVGQGSGVLLEGAMDGYHYVAPKIAGMSDEKYRKLLKGEWNEESWALKAGDRAFLAAEASFGLALAIAGGGSSPSLGTLGTVSTRPAMALASARVAVTASSAYVGSATILGGLSAVGQEFMLMEQAKDWRDPNGERNGFSPLRVLNNTFEGSAGSLMFMGGLGIFGKYYQAAREFNLVKAGLRADAMEFLAKGGQLSARIAAAAESGVISKFTDLLEGSADFENSAKMINDAKSRSEYWGAVVLLVANIDDTFEVNLANRGASALKMAARQVSPRGINLAKYQTQTSPVSMGSLETTDTVGAIVE